MNILMVAVGFGLRSSFTMILTQMVYIPNLNETLNPNLEIICPVDMIEDSNHGNQISTVSDKTYNFQLHALHKENGLLSFQMLNANDNRLQWSQERQGIILSSFKWGYFVAMFPTGLLIQKYGAKLVALVGFFVSTIFMALTPLAVAYGKKHSTAVPFGSTLN